MMATDGHTEDINKFLLSLGHCFEDADKASKDECNSVPLDYTESRLDDHLQIVNAIAIAIHYGGDELKQLVSNLQTFSQTLLYEIYTTKVEREASSVKSAAWVPCKEASTRGRPRYRITKDQIETLRETGMSWKRIAFTLGISDSTLYSRRQELGFHESFVDISYGNFTLSSREC